jgi:hypothetical protein
VTVKPWAICIASVSLGLVLADGVARAQVELERFFPPAVARGSATIVKADGKFPQWPVKIECDHSEVSVACAEKAGEFEVKPAATAVGAAWIRVHDDQSASSLVPLMIEPASVSPEVEPNESLSQALAISCPTTVVGKLEKNGDVDMWKVKVRAGEQLIASVTAHTLLGSPMDSVLQLVDSRGLIVVQAEDSVGLDPQLAFTATRDSDYYLRLFCFPETPTGTIGFAGGANFVYALRITTTAYVDHVLPLREIAPGKLPLQPYGWNLPKDMRCEVKPASAISPALIHAPDSLGWQWLPAKPVEGWSFGSDEQALAPESVLDAPLLYCGHIRNPREMDRVRLRARGGVNYRAEIVSREFGFTLDSVLRVLKSDLQTQLVRNDDSATGTFDAAVEFKTDGDEEVVIEVSDLADSGSSRHAYELQVTAVEPKANLTVAADHFRIGIGKSLEIPIAIERLAGYSQRMEIAARGLPAGIALETVNSELKGDSSKAVKLKLTAAADAAAFQGAIELIALPVDEIQAPLADPLHICYRLRPQILLSRVWLTVAAEKP